MEGSIRKRAGAVGDAEVLERDDDGVHRRERGRIPRGRRLRRGLHGVGRVPERLPVVAEIARAARRAHVHRRQGSRHGRLDSRGVPRGQISALHRAFLPQRAGEGPEIEEAAGRDDAQGHTRHGVARTSEAEAVAAELESMRLKEAAKVVREGFAETLAYCEMPREH